MANIAERPKVYLSITLELDEKETRALEALTGYGTDEFLKAFYKDLGRSYLEPWEHGLRSLFASIRADIPPLLARAEKARAVFNGAAQKDPDQ